MLRLSHILVAVLVLLIFAAGPVHAEEQPAVASALAMYYPQLQYQQINPTPIEGVFELVIKNSEIVYFVPASGHMFFGELWNAQAENLTQASKDQLMSAKRDMFPLDKALKIGDGPNQVIEVTDPDCPFCRKSSDYFATRDDVTRYVFLYPLSQLHPEATAKARYILSAKDPQLAYEEVFNGVYDEQPLPPFEDNGRLAEQRQILERVGINGTPRFWINGQHVAGHNPRKFDELLDR